MPSGRFTKRFKAEASQMLMRKRKYKFAKRRFRGSFFPVPEIKYYDFGLPTMTNMSVAANTNLGTGVTTCPYFPAQAGPTAVGCCFAPKLGNDINNRIGRKCAVHKIRIQGHVVIPSQTGQAAFDAYSTARLVLFVDKQANGAQATLADAFQTNSELTSPFASINVPQNLANLGRFRILKDKKITILQDSATGSPTATDVITAPIQKHFKISIKFRKPLIVHFNATNGGTYADIVENLIQFNTVCSNIAATPVIQYYGRIAYSDV